MKSLKFMLDTNIASMGLKGMFQQWQPQKNIERDEFCISILTKAEIIYGVRKKNSSNLSKLADNFFARIEVLPWDEDAADSYGRIRVELERQGLSLDTMDMLIAAHARSRNLILVTHDKAFYKAKHILTLADWLQA